MHAYSIESDQWEPPLEDNVQKSLCKEFKGNLSTGIWNSTALFCRDTVKAVQRLCSACELAGKVDLLVIVEAHGQNGSEVTFRERRREKPTCRIFSRYFSSGWWCGHLHQTSHYHDLWTTSSQGS